MKSIINTIRLNMSNFAVAIAMCGVALSQCLGAATLNVEFDVRTRAVEGDPVHQRKNVALFVLDRSGSMTWKPEKVEKLANGEKAENRNQLLVESFQERVLAISANAPDTTVYLIPFSGEKGNASLPYSLKTKSDVDKLLGWKGLRLDRCDGCTYLYDTLAYAISFAEKLSDKNPSVRLSLYVYTDGENETSGNAIYRSEKKRNLLGHIDQAAYERQLAEAKALFEKEHGWKISAYASTGKMETYWRWLGKGEPPGDSLMKTKDEYKISLAADTALLKNPATASEQKLSVSVGVPLPGKYVKDLDRATLTLQLAGRNVGRKIVSLRPGSRPVSFQFDDNISSDTFTGVLSLSDLPEWDRVVLRPPAPLELTFAAPGKLSFLEIEPKGELFVKKGSKVCFQAKATEDADIHWSWPGGSKTANACPITFTTTTPDPLDVLVTAKKRGHLPVEEKVKVHVIDADVGVSVVTSRPIVGEAIEFLAKAHGRPESYSWKIDNQTMSGLHASLKVPVFRGVSGKHVVSVRAYYGHGIMADSGDVPFVVAAKPYVEIVDPDSGNEYPFGEKIECKANVEGDFDKVVWELEGPVGEKQESAVDKTAKASSPVFFKPAKGGKYTLKATAVGSAGSLPAKASVVLKVAYEDLGISITSHASGTPVQVGRNAENLNLVAEVTGDKITNAKWFVRKESGEESEIRTTPVLRENGKRVAKCSFSPDSSTKDGASLFVRAEAVFDGDAPSEPVVSPSIELIATRYAAIEVEAKVNGGEANGQEVRFGDQVDLRAKCKGDIDANQVQWYKSTNGVVSKMESVRGSLCMSPKEVPNKDVPNGESLRTVRYFAVADLPDGSAVTSRVVVVHHYCPDIKCSIGLPRAGGVMRTSFGRAEAFDVQLEDEAGRLLNKLTDVKWDFGDGVTADTPVFHRPAYGKYDEFTIKASGKCPECGTRYYATPVKIKVEKQPPKAVLEILEKGSHYGTGDTIHLSAEKSSGDIVDYIWEIDGKEQAEDRGKQEVKVKLPKKPCEMVVKLTLIGPDGANAEAQRDVRVRWGAIVIVILLLLVVLVVVVLAKLMFDNGPAGWTAMMYCCERIDHSTDEGITEESLKIQRFGKKPNPNVEEFSIDKFWSKLDKMATIPLRDFEKSKKPAVKDFIRRCKDGVIEVKPGPKIDFRGKLNWDENDGFDGHRTPKSHYDCLYHYRQLEVSDDSSEESDLLRFLLDDSKDSPKYEIYFVILTLLVIVAAFWAALKYAI